LNDKKIKFEGQISDINDFYNDEDTSYSIDDYTPLFTWNSDSLTTIVSVINKNSQNFFAEQTLKTIGKELGGEGSFETSLEIVTAFLDSIGIHDRDIQMADGSGLSHYNIVKPDAIIRLFRYMKSSPNFESYFQSLAIPGVDRSVKNRLQNTEYRSNAHTKTGSIANTRTFSGYILGPKTGRLIAFSFMINNYPCQSSYVIDWLDSAAALILSEY